MFRDFREYRFQVFKYHFVLKPNYGISQSIQDLSALFVIFLGFGRLMDGAIQFNDKFFCGTVEVNNVVFDTVLPIEASAT